MSEAREAAAPPSLAQSLEVMAKDLGGLLDGILRDLDTLEQQLRELHREQPVTLATASASHLLASSGKRLRPFLCLVAARLRGPRASLPAAVALASAAELVHGATLLHDDVIDQADLRRGKPTARVLHGNAASVLGGDLLLVEALTAVRRAAVPGTLDSMLDVLRQMVMAESLQLAQRGSTELRVDDYFRICHGKTASLFEWVLDAGASADEAPLAQVEGLRRYGRELGVGFQLVDDLLDMTADPDVVGKAALQDVRQGTITYPALAALREEPCLAERLRAAGAGEADSRLGSDLLAAVSRHGGLEQTRLQIELHTRRARAALVELPDVPAVRALDTVAVELAGRAS